MAAAAAAAGAAFTPSPPPLCGGGRFVAWRRAAAVRGGAAAAHTRSVAAVTCAAAAPSGAAAPSPAAPAAAGGGAAAPAAAVSRRSVLAAAAGVTAAAAVGLLPAPPPAAATVDVDTDRYGDKEMKVSAINRTKANLRNLLATRPSLLSSAVLVGLHDTLTYDAATGAGGLNGSLRLELGRPQNAGVADAVSAIGALAAAGKDGVSVADFFAFAGAVAVEVAAGPRIVIQLGREDATEPDPPSSSALWADDAPAEELVAALNASGIGGAKELVLWHGAVGVLGDIGASREEANAALAGDAEEEEVDAMTYGGGPTGNEDVGAVGVKKRKGAVLVNSNVSTLTLGGKTKFGNGYLKALLAAEKAGKKGTLSTRDRVVLEDPACRAALEKYAGNNKAFSNDFANAFERMTLLGTRFESVKLLGS